MFVRVRAGYPFLMALALILLAACTALPPVEKPGSAATGLPVTSVGSAPAAAPTSPQTGTEPGVLAAQQVQQSLAELLGIAVDEVMIAGVEPVEWPDACLGAAAPDEMCAQIIVPGYRIMLEAGGRIYVYHTDTVGSQFRPEITDPATAAAMTVRLAFNGSGPNQGDADTKQTLSDLAAQVYPQIEREVQAKAACPASTEELQALANPGHGYCLTYPAEYKVEKPNPNSTVLVIGGLLDADHPRLEVRVDEGTGAGVEALADAMEADYAGFAIQRSATTVGGERAVVLDRLPGQEITRRVLFVHDGLLYTLDFAPADPEADAFAGMEALYEAVLGSFTFAPRAAQGTGNQPAGNECLSPTSKTLLLTDDVRGFCLLYPADYSVSAPSPDEVVLHAGSLQEVSRPKLFVQVEDAGGRTAEQVADVLVAGVQSAMPGMKVARAFGVTIGYEPAALLDGMPGQDLSRQVIAVHGDRVYKLIFVPADESQAEVYREMQRLYDLVLRSFRFLP